MVVYPVHLCLFFIFFHLSRCLFAFVSSKPLCVCFFLLRAACVFQMVLIVKEGVPVCYALATEIQLYVVTSRVS